MRGGRPAIAGINLLGYAERLTEAVILANYCASISLRIDWIGDRRGVGAQIVSVVGCVLHRTAAAVRVRQLGACNALQPSIGVVCRARSVPARIDFTLYQVSADGRRGRTISCHVVDVALGCGDSGVLNRPKVSIAIVGVVVISRGLI